MIRPYRETPDGEVVRRVARVACNSPFVRQAGYTAFVSRLCTVTVTDPDGRRHGLDALADPTYDAAHLFVVEAKKDLARRNTQTHSSDRLCGGWKWQGVLPCRRERLSSAGLAEMGPGRQGISSAGAQASNDRQLTGGLCRHG